MPPSGDKETQRILRTGSVFLYVRKKLNPPPVPTHIQNLDERGNRKRYGNPKHRCGFCGKRMRSRSQRTNHTSECAK